MRQASLDQDACHPPWSGPATAAELVLEVAPLITSSASVVYRNSVCSARPFTRRGLCLLIRERRNVPFLRQAAADIHSQVTHIDLHRLLRLASAHSGSG